MDFLNNLHISTRLYWGFGITVVLLVIVAITARIGLDKADETMSQLLEGRYAKVKLITAIKDSINQQARSTRNALIFDAGLREAELKVVDAERHRISIAYEQLETLQASEHGKRLFRAVQEKRQHFATPLEVFERQVRAGQMTTAREVLLNELRPRQLEYMQSLDDFARFEESLMTESGQALTQQIRQTTLLVLVAAVIGVIVAAVASTTVIQSVTRPVRSAIHTLERVAGGDLTVQVDATSRDEMGQLHAALGKAITALRSVVGQVHEGVESLSCASSQIAQGNADLSRRTEQQASSLQQTAANMEQLASTVVVSADNTRYADELAQAACGAAEHGGELVQRLIATMKEMHASSKRIAEIIPVIDGIAFQTNMLALNTAVEAARADDQGRGFTVVAGEAQNLAQRTAVAAMEISTLITDANHRVEQGAAVADEAGHAMNQIVVQVRRVGELIGEVTSRTREQTGGIDQISAAMSTLDETTQQNAALVEESTVATASLQNQAVRLSRAVAIFRVAQG
jgi:methyl-accepting chemotaxis protein